jgi:hypothetical protein
MRRHGYEILGFTVWHGGKWYVRRRYGSLLPSRRTLAAGLIATVVAVLAVQGARRELSSTQQ